MGVPSRSCPRTANALVASRKALCGTPEHLHQELKGLGMRHVMLQLQAATMTCHDRYPVSVHKRSLRQP